jgi:hypothetical protein
MRIIAPLICCAFVVGCASRNEVGVTGLPEPSAYSGSVVPLSSDAHVDSSVSKAEVEYLQKALASERDGGNAKIDSIYKTKNEDGAVIEVRRLYWYWRFEHTHDGQWLLLSHGTWFS